MLAILGAFDSPEVGKLSILSSGAVVRVATTSPSAPSGTCASGAATTRDAAEPDSPAERPGGSPPGLHPASTTSAQLPRPIPFELRRLDSAKRGRPQPKRGALPARCRCSMPNTFA